MESLLLKIQKASEVKCDSGCDHKSCLRNPIPVDPEKKNIIGRGAFGKVYKLTDQETNFEYAVKSIKIYQGEINEEVKSLEEDINKYRDIIKHPRIREYYGSILCSPKMYIFMEFVFKSLHNEMRQVESLPHLRIIRYTKQILEGLEFLHGKLIIHRDIKPRHILLDEKDDIKLCGFGLSKVLQSISNQKEENTFCGTANYMAPEVIIGEGYSFPADIWSVGATIVHMLTGKPPHSELEVEAAVMYRTMTTRKIEYNPLQPMSNNMKLFMEEILNPDPSKRLTAKELLQFLINHDMN